MPRHPENLGNLANPDRAIEEVFEQMTLENDTRPEIEPRSGGIISELARSLTWLGGRETRAERFGFLRTAANFC